MTIAHTAYVRCDADGCPARYEIGVDSGEGWQELHSEALLGTVKFGNKTKKAYTQRVEHRCPEHSGAKKHGEAKEK